LNNEPVIEKNDEREAAGDRQVNIPAFAPGLRVAEVEIASFAALCA